MVVAETDEADEYGVSALTRPSLLPSHWTAESKNRRILGDFFHTSESFTVH